MKNINLEKIENFRDLGGYECRYGETSFGVIYRSATLAYASEKDIKKILSLGIKSVVDLREDPVKQKLPNPFKNHAEVKYFPLNVNGNGRVPKDYQDGIDSYFEMLEDPYTARLIFKTFIYAPKPLVVHCNAGKDRTGVFVFMILLMNGVSFNDINADYMLSYPYLFNMTIDTMTNHPEVSKHVLTPNIFYLKDFYDEFFKRYGSAENYCESIGLNDEEVLALSNLLGKRENSYGAIVLNSENKVLVERMKEGHFALPKAPKEDKSLTNKEAAIKAVLDETGVFIELIGDYRITTFYSPGEGKLKEVEYYLAKAINDKVSFDKEKIKDVYFLSVPDAIRVLSYQSDKDILYKAIEEYNKTLA